MSSGDSKDAAEVDQTQASGDAMNGSTNGAGHPEIPASEAHSDQGAKIENVSHEDAIVAYCTFEKLMKIFCYNQYNVKFDPDKLILVKCKLLFKRDYELKIVYNKGLTDNYPKELLIPIARKNAPENEEPVNFDPELYSTLVHDCRVARLRSRVVVPVILFDRKLICRSGILTAMLSSIYEMAMTTLRSSEGKAGKKKYCLGICRNHAGASAQGFSAGRTVLNVFQKIKEFPYNSAMLITASSMISLVSRDTKVLEYLNVEHVYDLMSESEEHYEQQLNFSSTENSEGIGKYIIMEGMPFPGCEFFVSYKQANRNPEGLVFDWDQERDLIELTRNYLKIMLSYLLTSTGGMNVHCISGWDRTPLFVSLLRLTLWADGLVHKSLEPDEMAYFTVAYDWFLFGHNLPERIIKGEEVMHFAFNFLQYITSDEFSVTRMFRDLPEEKKMGRNMPEFEPERRVVLSQVRTFVLDAYNEHIIQRLLRGR